MANDFTANPMIFDTDFTSFQTASNLTHNVRVRRMVLAVGAGGASSAGTVSIVMAASPGTRPLYPPMPVAAAIAANQILVSDGPWTWDDALTWPDFKITGLTATGTRLFVWLRTN